MDMFSLFSIKCRNFKPFGSQPAGFECLKQFNIIIGRNNSGKTTLLDLIEFAKQNTADPTTGHKGLAPEVIYRLRINYKIYEFLSQIEKMPVFVQSTGGLNMFDGTVEWSKVGTGKLSPGKIEHSNPQQRRHLQDPVSNHLEAIYNHYRGCLSGLSYVRLGADRNIRPEVDDNPLDSIRADSLTTEGEGATRILNRMLNNNNFENRKLVEETIIADLNAIYRPDGSFSRILVLRQEGTRRESWEVESKDEIKMVKWEIHLEYLDGTTIPMSRMGSGVKTILLVLLMIHVVLKVVHKKPLSNFLFGFEELENNLHPAIQKRLFLYLRQIAEKEKCRFVITTHSHILIDMFSKDELAQILHVFTDQNTNLATVSSVSGRPSHNTIFEDLDVRASDLLQSNCIVWVEGPSDRVYFNRWVELFDPNLQEHVDYEFAFTSGTLISHNTFDPEADDNTSVERMIQAIRLNRNAIVLMDRDRMTNPLKPWVVRVAEEVTNAGGMAWITVGKEVENYLPSEVLRIFLQKPEIPKIAPGISVFQRIKSNGGGDYSSRKVQLAERVCPLISKEMMFATLDLGNKVEAACSLIRRWNARPKP